MATHNAEPETAHGILTRGRGRPFAIGVEEEVVTLMRFAAAAMVEFTAQRVGGFEAARDKVQGGACAAAEILWPRSAPPQLDVRCVRSQALTAAQILALYSTPL